MSAVPAPQRIELSPAVRAILEADIRLDFSVGVKRSTCVPPAFSLQFYVLVDRKSSSHKKFLCLANTRFEELLGNVLGGNPTH